MARAGVPALQQLLLWASSGAPLPDSTEGRKHVLITALADVLADRGHRVAHFPVADGLPIIADTSRMRLVADTMGSTTPSPTSILTVAAPWFFRPDMHAEKLLDRLCAVGARQLPEDILADQGRQYLEELNPTFLEVHLDAAGVPVFAVQGLPV